jgi:single-stranded-DNA-specific exonuclease
VVDSSPEKLVGGSSALGVASQPLRRSPEAGFKLPEQRWQQPESNPLLAESLATTTGLPPLLTQVLINRGITTPEQAAEFLNPERQRLPSPMEEFPDLALSVELLLDAIEGQQSIMICGDYDADGMTSTALLMRALKILGAQVDYAIPSRMNEGYGINQRIVEECYAEGVSLILTVDNGIAALGPIERARELGLAVIVTDHHDIPPQLPPANAILNPKLLSGESPFRGVAGVGVAYILAICLAQALDMTQDLTGPLLELFTLGTIADLAPLVGVNRRWVRRGLGLLPRSRILGIQALIQVAGLADQSKPLKPEHIGFRLGPRINAVGRISDPQVVIDMLTTEDVGVALERAMQCEQINTTRQNLCQTIEEEAVAWCEHQQQIGAIDLLQDRVLLVVQPGWHHGVIGIVASRLVERYGVPVFIGTYEDDEHKLIRGSARGIPEFDVFAALNACHDLMEKFGGHRAAGGFTFLAKHLRQVKTRLANFANQHLTVDLLKPLVSIDVQADLNDIHQTLYDQIDLLHPCGIENPDPVFWTPNVQVEDQQLIGRNGNHLKLVLRGQAGGQTIKAVAWRWGEYYPLPAQLDIAYKLKQNDWQGNRTVELELLGARPAGGLAPQQFSPPPQSITQASAEQDIQTLVEAEQDMQARATQGSPRHGRAQATPEVSPPERPVQTSTPPLASGKVQPPPEVERATQPALRHAPQGAASFKAADVETTSQPATTGVETTPSLPQTAVSSAESFPAPAHGAEFFYSKRRYWAATATEGGTRKLTIGNPEGQLLVVSLSEKQGFLCLPGAEPKPVNVSEAHYFNLIRAGLNAVELQQMAELVLEKDELLAEKDNQIQTLSRQVALLEQQLSQASQQEQQQFQQLQAALQQQESAIQSQEAHIARMQAEIETPAPKINPQQLRQKVRQAVGDQAWFCLSTASQKDLYTAFKQVELLSTGDNQQSLDYSAASRPLSQTVEREILQPLLQDFSQYGQQINDADIIALADELTRQADLQSLPALLSESWQSFTAKALKAKNKPRKALLQAITADEASFGSLEVDDTHRVLLDEFLQGWEHPMARWMTQANADAASTLAQIHQLQQLAAEDQLLMPRWQFDLLYHLLVGDPKEQGVLQKIFGG